MNTPVALLALAVVGACAATPNAMPWPADLPSALRDAIRNDAARRAGIGAERVQVVSAQAVTWRDGALGCPEPGRLYTQALRPGWRIEVSAPDAAPLLYHASRGGVWTWCPRERAQAPAATDLRN